MAPQIIPSKAELGGVSAAASYSSSMMEHHIAASVLDASKKLATLIGSDGTQFIMSIGSDDAFRLSADLSSSCSSWTTLDIASGLLSQKGFAGAKVKTFDVSVSPSTGTITIVLAITLSAGYDVLYVADALDSSKAASWLAKGGIDINWQQVAYDSTAFDSITAQSLHIFEISLLLSWSENQNEQPIAHVEIVDPTNNLHRVYSVVIPPGTVGSGSAWTYLQLPFDSSEALQIASGQPFPNFGQGVYVLGQQGDSTTLDFIPANDQSPTFSYQPVPDGADAIASLVLPDQSTSSTTTELYVASTNQLTIMKSGNHPSQQKIVISKPTDSQQPDVDNARYIDGTTFLHVSTNYGEPGVKPDKALVTVFGLNSSNQVFYTYAVYEDRFEDAAFAPVILLLNQAQRVAPVINSAVGTLGFLGTSSSPSVTGSTTYGTPQPLELVSMISNPASHTWQQHSVPVPITTDYIRLQTYTTKVCVNDATTKLPLPLTTVNITTTTNTTILVNGSSIFCTGGSPTPIPTDSNGCLSICNSISSIEALRFTISDGNGTVLVPTPDGSSSSNLFDPASTVSSKLQSGMTGTLTSLTYPDGNGQPQPLVDATNTNLATAATTFNNINNSMPTKRASDITEQRGNALEARAMVAKRRQLARKQAIEHAQSSNKTADVDVEEDLGFSIEMFLSDVVQWVCTAVEDVANIVVKAVKDAVHLVVNIGEGIFHAVIETVEDAWNAIVCVFKWVGAEFEKIFRWLAFIFDWKEMVTVHNGLKKAITSGIHTSAGQLDTIKSTLVGLLDSAQEKLDGENPLSNMSDSFQNSVSSKGPSPTVNGVDVKTNPNMGWVSDQLQNSKGANITSSAQRSAIRLAASRKPPVVGDDNPTFASAVASAGNAAGNSGNSDTLNQLNTSMKGDGSGGSAIWNAVTGVGDTIIGAIKSEVEAAFAVASSLEDDAMQALNTEIEIPVLTGIYTDLVGTPPSILDITCLCAAIVSTIGYNIVKSSNQQSLGDYVNSSEFQDMFTNNALSLEKTGSSRTSRVSLKDGGSSPAYGFLGGVAILDGFAVLAGAIGESFEAPELSSVATIAGDICAIITGAIGVGMNANDPDFADFIVVGIGLRTVILMALAQSVGRSYEGLAGKEAQSICLISDVIDTGLGIWALVNIFTNGAGNASAGDWLGSLGDFLSFWGSLANLLEQPEIGGVISVLRVFGAEGVGISFFDTLTQGSQSMRHHTRAAPEIQPTSDPQSTTTRSEQLQDSFVDSTSLSLTGLDMAFVIDETTANNIALGAVQLPQLDVEFSYDANFNDSSSHPMYSCSGTLYFTSSSPISCGAVGTSVAGGGVLWNYTLGNMNATVNGNKYSNKGQSNWIMQLVVSGYKLEMQTTQSSQVVRDQQSYMETTYGADMQLCDFGIDIGKGLGTTPDTTTPDGWTSSDWQGFCNAVCYYLNNNTGTINTAVPLIQGVVPQSSTSTQWNVGPTDWRCFNVPAPSSDYQGGIVYGFMVGEHKMPASPSTDFNNVALFSTSGGSSQPNGFLFISSSLMTSAIRSYICTDNLLQSLASIGLNVKDFNNDGNPRVFWDPTGITEISTPELSDPWQLTCKGGVGDHEGINQWQGQDSNFSVSSQTLPQITLTYSAPENSFFQQLKLEGQYPIPNCIYSYPSDSEDSNIYVNDMPSVYYSCHVEAVLSISQNTVSFTYQQDADSMSSDPDPVLTNSDYAVSQWKAAPQFGDLVNIMSKVQSDDSSHPRIGVLAGNVILDGNNGFCRTGNNTTQSQVNLFAFPQGSQYQSADKGVNQKGTLVLRLTYVITS